MMGKMMGKMMAQAREESTQGTKNKDKGGGGSSRSGGGRGSASGGVSKQQALNNAVLKVLGRPKGQELKKEEIEYKCQRVQGGTQATVRIQCLPESKAGRGFVGNASPTEQEALDSVASIALDEILKDPVLKE